MLVSLFLLTIAVIFMVDDYLDRASYFDEYHEEVMYEFEVGTSEINLDGIEQDLLGIEGYAYSYAYINQAPQNPEYDEETGTYIVYPNSVNYASDKLFSGNNYYKFYGDSSLKKNEIVIVKYLDVIDSFTVNVGDEIKYLLCLNDVGNTKTVGWIRQIGFTDSLPIGVVVSKSTFNIFAKANEDVRIRTVFYRYLSLEEEKEVFNVINSRFEVDNVSYNKVSESWKNDFELEKRNAISSILINLLVIQIGFICIFYYMVIAMKKENQVMYLCGLENRTNFTELVLFVINLYIPIAAFVLILSANLNKPVTNYLGAFVLTAIMSIIALICITLSKILVKDRKQEAL